jgi:hypothetical protein
MPDDVTIAANLEATEAALTACELPTRLIHHTKSSLTAPEEVVPTTTTN